VTRYLSLAEFWYLAEHVTGINAATLIRASRVELADSCLVLFVDLSEGSWNDDHPDTDDAVAAMLAVAAREVDEAWLATWLRERVTFRH
jgi:death-on-curing protein